ncbi:hypothetical protein LTR70_003416 [Exophiala xenobiotica]|uniref:Uncharacterized protein n=1 Tax=Lithohypha guttulata TaxID=1690604 RepID=A0ABR0KGG9_9EURO|nr:hypothetical protein LTR24_002963 [Lithohypha guttulata]KAK5323554.1 hypothetical protein LTR70_003416 [Exophiala xenobiotica]
MSATGRKDRQPPLDIGKVGTLSVGPAYTDDTEGRYSRYGGPPKTKPPEERPPPPKPRDGNDKPPPPPKGPRVPSIPGVD